MQRFINNWAATLTAPATSGDLTLSVDPAEAAKLVGLGSGDHYVLTLAEVVDEVETSWEIVKVTAATGGLLTVEWQQEGTGPFAWSVGASISARATAGTLERLRDSAGAEGASAYEVAVANGFVGTEAAWLESLIGAPGADGADGADGAAGASAYQVAVANGFVGTELEWLESLEGAPGADGADGAGLNIVGELPSSGDLPGAGSPGAGYIIAGDLWLWVDGAWLNTGPIRGPQGEPGAAGADGEPGDPGPAGASAYQVAVANGFVGTEAAWLASLQGAPGSDGLDGAPGADGADGPSAYEVALANGFVGTEAQWLESLIGDQGPPGAAPLGLPYRTITASGAVTPADAGKWLICTSATPITLTIGAEATAAWTTSGILPMFHVLQVGAGAVTVTGDGFSVTLHASDTNVLAGAGAAATALWRASNTWSLIGRLVAA